MTKRHTRTAAKMMLATQLNLFIEQVKTLRKVQQETKYYLSNTVKISGKQRIVASVDEQAAAQAVLLSNRTMISQFEAEITVTRQRIRDWDKRSHNQDTVVKDIGENEEVNVDIALKTIDSFNDTINSKRQELKEMSASQRSLKKTKSTLSNDAHSHAQCTFDKNRISLNKIQKSIGILKAHYDKAHENWFQLTLKQ